MAKQSVQSGQEPGIAQKILTGLYNVADHAVGSAIAAMWDIHSKLVDQGWFGRDSFNTMYYQNRRNVGLDQHQPNQQQEVAVEDLQQTVKDGHEHEFNPDALYGRTHDKEAEQQHSLERDDDLAMER